MDDTQKAKTPRLALGIAEAAEAIGCSPGHIRNLIGRQELRSTKVGRRRVVLTKDLVAYLNSPDDDPRQTEAA